MIELLPTRLPGAPFDRAHPTRRPRLHNIVTRRWLLERGGARTLNGVLAEGRHASSPRIKPAAVVGGGVVLVIAVVLVVALLGGGGGRALIGGSEPSTPSFSFKVTKVVAVPTRPDATAAKLKGKAKAPANEVVQVMDALYVQAFLNPENWQNASYDDVWSMFESGAGAQAQQQVDTLTAGSGAGAVFDEILPKSGTLKAKVLLDPKDEPSSVVAIVKFVAIGSGKDGKDLAMTSQGQYVFQKIDGTWKVVSFKVVRNDVPKAPSPSASASASGSPS
jgi:hypothetical protein